MKPIRIGVLVFDGLRNDQWWTARDVGGHWIGEARTREGALDLLLGKDRAIEYQISEPIDTGEYIRWDVWYSAGYVDEMALARELEAMGQQRLWGDR